MPSRNVLKIDVGESYYHVYGRGGSRHEIFLDEEDYRTFLGLFSRYLSNEEKHDHTGRAYAHLSGQIELLAYCLMPNHFHLLVYQQDTGATSTLMRGILTAYSRYFNHKYDRSGPLLESRYKASRISNDTYLTHISRYIHLNPREWQTWKYSSYHAYKSGDEPEILSTERVLELFRDRATYLEFVADYEDIQRLRESIKHELADG